MDRSKIRYPIQSVIRFRFHPNRNPEMVENSQDNVYDGRKDPWPLLFAARKSIRYHRYRERFFDRWHNTASTMTAVMGSATIASLLATKEGLSFVVVVATATAVAGAADLVFGFARRARRHNDLARDFTALEQNLKREGETIPADRHRELVIVRLEIESREPPVLNALDCICHDELVTAHNLGDGYRSNLTGLQRAFAQWFDFQPGQIRLRAEELNSGRLS